MTQEDKAKAYDEALERARKMLNMILDNELLGFPDQIREIFPQLRESNDERIREELIEYHKRQFENNRDQEVGLFHKDAIAYLEKQEEQKLVNHNLTTWHRDVVYCAMCDKNLDEGLRCNLEIVYKTIKEIVDRTPVVVEQKPEWSEEDKEAIDMCLDAIPKAWKTKSGILLTKWLRDKLNSCSQPKQEWSEEDEKKLERVDDLLWMLDDYISDDCSICEERTARLRDEIHKELSPWLNALRNARKEE